MVCSWLPQDKARIFLMMLWCKNSHTEVVVVTDGERGSNKMQKYSDRLSQQQQRERIWSCTTHLRTEHMKMDKSFSKLDHKMLERPVCVFVDEQQQGVPGCFIALFLVIPFCLNSSLQKHRNGAMFSILPNLVKRAL